MILEDLCVLGIRVSCQRGREDQLLIVSGKKQ